MSKEFAAYLHAYQPERKMNVDLPIGRGKYHTEFEVVPWINRIITDKTYKLLGEVPFLPQGLFTSFYAPLRSYLKREQPELYLKIRNAITNTPNKEYAIFGDPLIHAILPLLQIEDQEMLIVAGKMAIEDDLGFTPKGLWLPEIAVSKQTLKLLARNGYKFVPLRDYQVQPLSGNQGKNEGHNNYLIDLGDGDEINAMLGNSELSGKVAFEQWITVEGPRFMQMLQRGEYGSDLNPSIITDFETFGWHHPDADKFLRWILGNLGSYGFEPLNLKTKLEDGKIKRYANVSEGTSWSCPHIPYKRWTGGCNCDNPNENALEDKRIFFTSLKRINEQLNIELDGVDPNWRSFFIDVLVAFRDDIFTGVNFAPALAELIQMNGKDEYYLKLFLAKIEGLIGMTSCGWFFGLESSPERNIPASMIQAVEGLGFVPLSL